jgi:hypothetical protein
MALPHDMKQGEPARLFPVLATTSKEGRATAIFLSCLSRVNEFGAQLLARVGHRVGKRTQIACYTEVVFKTEKTLIKDRPDGVIICSNGKNQWRALIEAKIGNAALDAAQIERYRSLAKEVGADCVITISNQFTSDAQIHPLEPVRKSRLKIPVFHWSWMSILTETDLLLGNAGVADPDQVYLLSELRRFLAHDSAGVKGFERMPPAWNELNKLVTAGGRIPAKSSDARDVVQAWHQETRDLALILSRQTDVMVSEAIPRKHAQDLALREKAALETLCQDGCLSTALQIPGAAAALDITADLTRRTVDVGMSLKAPEDKVSTKARVNWLLRQIHTEQTEDLHIRLLWPGRSEATVFSFSQLRADPALAEADKTGLQVRRFEVFYAWRLGARFTQRANFITDLEQAVPAFYREVGQSLTAWRKPAPRIKHEDTPNQPAFAQDIV